MFISLLWQECKMWLKSIVFYAYVIILFLFYVTQMGDNVLEKPEPGQEDYGTVYSNDKDIIMEGAVRDLIMEYESGFFITYPVGFYKQVTLSESENAKIEEYIGKLTGMDKTQWEQEKESYTSGELTYEKFQEIMKETADIIGKGSDYSEGNLKKHGKVNKTYEQALSDYEDVVKKDHVTGAYARLFSDYMGILLGILPAFFGVSRVLKDKRSKASQLVYSKKACSAVIILSRYVGMTVMLFLPVLILSCFSLTQALYVADAIGASPDYFAYMKYCAGWLLPAILFVLAVSYLITELTESILGMLVNGVLWFIAVFSGMDMLLMGAGWNLIPRFNSFGEYNLFREMVPQLIHNRIVYTAASFILVVILIAIYEMKRKGGYQVRGKVSKNRNRKHPA